MKVVVTGSDGFLGWHTRVRLRAMTDHDVVAVGRSNWRDLSRVTKGADAVIHIAGVNRASPQDVEQGNVDLARAVAEAAVHGGSRPRIVYANSIQAGTDTAYGRGKGTAGEVLDAAARECGGSYVDVRLPNLFGEHGRPNYNSFVATFVEAVIQDAMPQVDDREITVLHAQTAAASLITGLSSKDDRFEPAGRTVTVQSILNTLRELGDVYASGDIPSLESDLRIDLFNTLRAAMFPRNMPILLKSNTDPRGRLVETVRTHGGQGQTFVSTTRPGSKRGDHFHLRKVERFVVVSGTAQINLRKLLSSSIFTFDVTGAEPKAIDMPTMWAHNIINVGHDELVTQFWTNTLFDPLAADTCGDSVGLAT